MRRLGEISNSARHSTALLRWLVLYIIIHENCGKINVKNRFPTYLERVLHIIRISVVIPIFNMIL